MDEIQNTRRSANKPPERDSRSHNQKGKRRRRRKKKSVLGSIAKVLLVTGVIVVFAVAGAGLGTVFGILQSTEMLNTSDIVPESYTSVIFDGAGNTIDKLHGTENREYVKLSGITSNLQNAVVAIEDERFYKHNGIDMRGIMRAMKQNIVDSVATKKISFSQGASTITQQLLKNEVLSSEKKVERKIKEQYLAVSLEKALEKQLGSKEAAKKYILELYLNTISLHHGLHGVEAASLYYFSKHAGELTLAESAMIAGITKNPSVYAPDANQEESRKRQLTVLGKMKDLEYITAEQYNEAVAEDIFGHLVCKDTSSEESGNAKHSYFVEAAIDQIAQDLIEKRSYNRAQAYNMIYSGGLQIHLTVDSRMQEILEASMKDDSLFPPSDGTLDVTYLISVQDTSNPDENSNQSHYERKATVHSEDEVDAFVESVKAELLDSTHTLVLDKVTVSKSLQAAMVIMDQHNGELKALVGGRGEKPGDSVFNRATQALRQQGSAMKPLAAYAPAIDTGLLMPGSVIIDEVVTYGSWSPKNWDGKYIGPTTVRRGIWHSMNVLAVKAFMMVTAEVSYDYLLKFGFTTITDEDKAATTALGGLTTGVSTLEMTAAYASMANGGTYRQPIFYSVVYDHEGNVLLSAEDTETHQVLKPTTAYMLTDMMKDVITRGTGGQARISGMTVAGKTGTTNDTKDLTFYGYTPYYTGGIWMGYDTAKTIASGSAHLQIWRTVMQKIHQEQGLTDKEIMARPDGIVTQTYCSATGLAPTELCSQDYYGFGTHSDLAASDFNIGGACNLHKAFTVCTESGKIAAPTCPDDCKMSVVLAVSDGGSILGKSTEGKMDIDVNAVCDMSHTPTQPEYPQQPPYVDPVYPEGPTVPPEEQIPDMPNEPEDNFEDYIPENEIWGGGEFGIQ